MSRTRPLSPSRCSGQSTADCTGLILQEDDGEGSRTVRPSQDCLNHFHHLLWNLSLDRCAIVSEPTDTRTECRAGWPGTRGSWPVLPRCPALSRPPESPSAPQDDLLSSVFRITLPPSLLPLSRHKSNPGLQFLPLSDSHFILF